MVGPGNHECCLVERRCRSRICPLCSRQRAGEVGDHLLAIVSQMDSPRMLTLTLRSTDRPIGDELDRLVKAFRAMRQDPMWKRCVVGGVWAIEVTWSESRQQWHPHIHAVLDGSYMAQATLSSLWHKATGDSQICDIRLIHSRKSAARYIAKYCSKGADLRKFPADRIAEYAEAIASRRLYQTFGQAHKIRRTPPDRPDRTSWHQLPEWAHAHGAWRSEGDDVARSLCKQFAALADQQSRPLPEWRSDACSTHLVACVRALNVWWEARAEARDPARLRRRLAAEKKTAKAAAARRILPIPWD
jgi:hypothetical protein